jgi:hypothetical protein
MGLFPYRFFFGRYLALDGYFADHWRFPSCAHCYSYTDVHSQCYTYCSDQYAFCRCVVADSCAFGVAYLP